MTDFECRYGHFMPNPHEDCKQCAKEGRFGQRAFYMDGYTAHQYSMMERECRDAEPEEEEDE